MCEEYCGDRGFLWRSVGLDGVASGVKPMFNLDLVCCNCGKLFPEFRGVNHRGKYQMCSAECVRQFDINTTPKYKLICSSSDRADPMALIGFQEEFSKLLSQGVPAEDIVKAWNDSQDSFYNKVYLVKEDKHE
jgi:hypothetical protein